MKYSPSLETIKAYAESGAYKILPVSCELLADLCTPIEALRRLKQVSTHCYLLESVAEREKWGRCSRACCRRTAAAVPWRPQASGAGSAKGEVCL